MLYGFGVVGFRAKYSGLDAFQACGGGTGCGHGSAQLKVWVFRVYGVGLRAFRGSWGFRVKGLDGFAV